VIFDAKRMVIGRFALLHYSIVSALR